MTDTNPLPQSGIACALRSERPLLHVGASYFTYYGAAAALIPFLVLYYQSHGFSVGQIGVLVGIPPLVMLIGAPLWGGLADATQQHGLILRLAIIGSLLLALALSQTQDMDWLIPVVIGYALFTAPIMPLMDNAALKVLGSRQDRYGKLRLWGAVGWGVAAPITGWLVECDGLAWAFYGYMALMLLCLLALWRLPAGRDSQRAAFWGNLRTLLADRRWPLFLTTVVMGRTGTAMIGNFLFLYLNDLQAGKTLMGLSMTIATLRELPVLFFAGRLLNRWGAGNVLAAALALYGLRAFAYSAAHTPGSVLLIQLLHGPSFSALWAAGVAYASASAPEGLGVTAQTLFTAATLGIGGALGGWLGGQLYGAYGPSAILQWAGLATLFAALLFSLTRANSALWLFKKP
jgi:PPP family 3-phenylpropionic acid transporter